MAEEKKERQETAARDKNGVRKNDYRRFKEGRDYEKQTAPDMVAMCDMMSRGIFGAPEDRERGKGGRPRKYETIEELQEGIQKYLVYIAEQNAAGVALIPDVEGLALFLGVSRSTLYEWQRARPGEFSDTLKRTLNAIAAAKKQLALMGKIPPLVFATDFNNNHGYTQQQNIEITAARKLERLPSKEEIIKSLPQNEGIDEDPGEIIL